MLLKKKRQSETCKCNAYPFPHRPGGGKCYDPGEEPSSCASCEWNVPESMGSLENAHPAYCNHPDRCPWYK